MGNFGRKRLEKNYNSKMIGSQSFNYKTFVLRISLFGYLFTWFYKKFTIFHCKKHGKYSVMWNYVTSRVLCIEIFILLLLRECDMTWFNFLIEIKDKKCRYKDNYIKLFMYTCAIRNALGGGSCTFHFIAIAASMKT